MRFHRMRLCAAAAVYLGGIAEAPAALSIPAGVYSAVTRVSGFPDAVYALTTGSDGSVYWSTGTATGGYNGRIMRVAPDGTVQTITPAVGGVIGVHADLEFGFGGNLYGNSLFPRGVWQFALPSGSPSTFWGSGDASPDAGLAFDATNQILYVNAPGSNSVYAVNSAGVATLAATTTAANGWGLAIETAGTVLVMSASGELARVDPVAHTATPLANLSTLVPNWASGNALDVDPLTGDIYFTASLASDARELYSLNPDATGLTLVAFTDTGDNYGGFLNMKIGPSGDGSGDSSIYLSFNGNRSGIDGRIVELRQETVPEPSTLVIFSALTLIGLWYGRIARLIK